MPKPEQWLELHRLCLDTLRAALEGIPENLLSKRVVALEISIGDEIAHVIGCEAYWLREVGIVPKFSAPPPDDRSGIASIQALDRIDEQYKEILIDRDLNENILFGLGRVCQHALYHQVRIRKIRRILQPDWTAPVGYSSVGSWERAADYFTDLLILGENAKPRSE